MKLPFELVDRWGPYQIVHIHRPQTGLKAIVVIDNVACGPAIGGTRMAPDVSMIECARLARAMTFKNAAAGLPHGGAKSVIYQDPGVTAAEKERVMRDFACSIADLKDYIPGPDMGTNERAMAWVHDEIGRAVGLPREIGGIPLDEIGATGLGVAIAAEVAQRYCDLSLNGARVAVQGFGAVGRHAAQFLALRGTTLVAASDSTGTLHDPAGINIEALVQLKQSGKPVTAMQPGKILGRDEIVSVDCDIWIPAARPDVLTKENVNLLKAKLIVQGANIPATLEAEEIMHRKGIICVPDFIANAGGVICASVEYHGGNESMALAVIAEKVERNTEQVLSKSKKSGQLPRQAADELAQERVKQAMSLRRWG
ncbi:MAG: Glu/Leu/Phe/Val family dehydrogenase [bacterium]